MKNWRAAMLDVPKALCCATMQGCELSFTQQTALAAGTSVSFLLFNLCSPWALCEAEDVDAWITLGRCWGAAQVNKIHKPVTIPLGETQDYPALRYSSFLTVLLSLGRKSYCVLGQKPALFTCSSSQGEKNSATVYAKWNTAPREEEPQACCNVAT